MVKRIGGSRRKTRQLFRKHCRRKGKISTSRFFSDYKKGDKVLLDVEPAVQKAMYHSRFHSKIGRIVKKRGDCYELIIKDGNKDKLLIIHPVHLRRIT